MLDSLVRVSRRVGWRADRFATDPVPAGPPHGPSKEAVGRHGCPVSASRTSREGGGGLHRRRLLGPQADRDRRGYNSRRRNAHLPSSPPSDRPENRSWRSACGKCTRPTRVVNARRVPKDLRPDARAAPSELNSAGRLCGSTRLPLGGFTYC